MSGIGPFRLSTSLACSLELFPDSCRLPYSIVFVHGLGGHPYSTWATTSNIPKKHKHSFLKGAFSSKRHSGQSSSVSTPETCPEVFWPVHLLLQSEGCATCRILSWGHASSVLKAGKPADQTTVFQHGMNLYHDLRLFREKNNLEKVENAQNIVFVGHSLGGIIIKEVSSH